MPLILIAKSLILLNKSNYIYSKKLNIMNLQADLKWIHQELHNIEDPSFIEAIKNIIVNRKKHQASE